MIIEAKDKKFSTKKRASTISFPISLPPGLEKEKWPEVPTEQTAFHLESTEGHKRFDGLHIENAISLKGVTFRIVRATDGEIWIKLVEVTDL